jgi:hypothetical protein
MNNDWIKEQDFVNDSLIFTPSNSEKLVEVNSSYFKIYFIKESV